MRGVPFRLLAGLLLALSLIACAPATMPPGIDAGSPPAGSPTPSTTPAATQTPVSPSATPTRPPATATAPVSPTPIAPERVKPTTTRPAVTGEVPAELLAAITADLMQRAGVGAAQIHVRQAQAVVWNDGALGCPRPGVFYTQALVNGYQVVLEAEGKTYDYRATDKAYFILCEHGVPPISRPSTPAS